MTGPPTLLGNPHCAYAPLFDPGRTVHIRPIRCDDATHFRNTRGYPAPMRGPLCSAGATFFAVVEGYPRQNVRLPLKYAWRAGRIWASEAANGESPIRRFPIRPCRWLAASYALSETLVREFILLLSERPPVDGMH